MFAAWFLGVLPASELGGFYDMINAPNAGGTTVEYVIDRPLLGMIYTGSSAPDWTGDTATCPPNCTSVLLVPNVIFAAGSLRSHCDGIRWQRKHACFTLRGDS